MRLHFVYNAFTLKQLQYIMAFFSVATFVAITIFFTACEPDEPQQQEIEYSNWDSVWNAKYVGTQTCINCHADIFETYQHTGKWKAFYPPNRNNIIENFEKVLVYDSLKNFYYTAFWSGETMYIAEFRLKGKDTTYYRKEKVSFVVGSGNQTRSYVLEEKGYLYEMPITWYTKKQQWDLSPGYENGNNSRFERPIGQKCLDCHSSQFEAIEHSFNRFSKIGEGIGCEKCHGAGSYHVNFFTKNASNVVDSNTIVNPSRLPIQLQLDVCRQCHLEGITVLKPGKEMSDFKPGMLLGDIAEIFIPVAQNSEDFGFASHAERLQMSRCFTVSENLTCTSCHHAHETLPQNQQLFYTQKCLQCHTTGHNCSKIAATDMSTTDCVPCHMKKGETTDIPHVSSADHYIRVLDTAPQQTQSKENKKILNFRNFTQTHSSNRSKAMAFMIYYEEQEANPEYLQQITEYVAELAPEDKWRYYFLSQKTPSITELPTDTATIQHPFTAYYLADIHKNKQLPYLLWLQRAANLAPDNITILYRLALAYQVEGKTPQSIEIYQAILERNPKHAPALNNLAYALLQEKRTEKAINLLKKALQIEPDYRQAQENLSQALKLQSNQSF